MKSERRRRPRTGLELPSREDDISERIIGSTSNDNPQPIKDWINRLLPWAIWVGFVLGIWMLR